MQMGVDLGDYYTGGLSLRRLRILVKYLPGEAKLAKIVHARRRAAGLVDQTKIEDADPSVWSQTEWLLVQVIDLLQSLDYSYTLVHRDPAKPKPPPPPRLPRPGDVPQRRRTVNAWFGALGFRPLEKPVRT